MSRAWIITNDYLSGDQSRTEVGVTGPRGANSDDIAKLKKGAGIAFVMKDDDGIAYYRGRCIWSDGEDLETAVNGPLGDFGMPNAGCTSISYPKHPEYDCG